ncbi:hypothetical protein BaRGS_00037043 [Batillaria attramentaria]|uniref:Uncharacterized protein n=1 Tax=Batillaria attramentaria TaxID=370345 RepID=A0ABD0J9X4_9CAEN
MPTNPPAIPKSSRSSLKDSSVSFQLSMVSERCSRRQAGYSEVAHGPYIQRDKRVARSRGVLSISTALGASQTLSAAGDRASERG